MDTGAGAVAIGPRAFSQVPGGFGAPAYMIRTDHAMALPTPPSGPRRSSAPKRPSGDERVVAAPDGLLWNASHRRNGDGDGAIVFSCITESRLPARAVAVGRAFRLRDASDDELLRLFADAPVVGKLI
jgi:hypothetical protein